MKMKKWLKCLLMAMTLMMVVNVGTVATTIPAAAKAKTESVKKGTKFWSGKLQYKVTSLKGKKGTASLIGAKSSVTSVSVPKTVKKGKYTLTVNEIGANAFKNCKKLKKVVTNTELKKIGKNAFSGCKKLTTVDIRSKKVTSVGKNALPKNSKKITVKVPKGKEKSYKKLLNVPIQEPETKAAKTTTKAKANTSAQTEAPKTAQTEAPKAVQTEAAKTAQTEALKAAQTAVPKTVQTAAPKAAQTAVPKTVQTAAPKAAQTEAPKTVQTEVPKAAQTEAPKPVQTEAPKAAQTEAPKPVQTEAPKAAQTEAPKPVQTEAPKPVQTEAPKAVETEAVQPEVPEVVIETEAEQTETPEVQTEAQAVAPKVVETEAAQTEPSKVQNAAPAPQTEAPKETEHEHEYTWVVTSEPHCGYLGNDMTWRDTGSKTGTCIVCGKTVKKGLRAEHQFTETVTLPTCEKDGVRSYVCELCGYKKSEPGEKAFGHELEHHEVPATCTEDGYSYDECVVCGKIENKQITEEKTGHNFSEENVVVNDATCEMDGQRIYTCTHEGCGEIRAKRIPKKEHEYVEEEIPATCTSPEKIVITCKNGCGYQKVRTGKAVGHKMQVTDEEAQDGYVTEKCTECGYTQTVRDPKAEHSVHGDGYWVDLATLREGLSEEAIREQGLHEGVLASRSGGKIKTQRCEECQRYGRTELRYVYKIGDAWVPWSEVPCNGGGHEWGETNCEICGATKPGKNKYDVPLVDIEGKPTGETGGDLASRIVWGAVFTSDGNCVGFEYMGGIVSSASYTTISSDNVLEVAAPRANDGYVFDRWTWSREGHESDVPAELFKDGRSDLLCVTCDYMDVVFTAHYRAAGAEELQTSAETAAETDVSAASEETAAETEVSVAAEEIAAPADVSVSAEMSASADMPEVVHGEMEFDLFEDMGDSLTPEEHVFVDQSTEEYELIMEEHQE